MSSVFHWLIRKCLERTNDEDLYTEQVEQQDIHDDIIFEEQAQQEQDQVTDNTASNENESTATNITIITDEIQEEEIQLVEFDHHDTDKSSCASASASKVQKQSILYETNVFEYSSLPNNNNNNTTSKSNSNFTSNDQVLSIPPNSFIFPGSQIQLKMAEDMKQSLISKSEKEEEDDDDDECVICMETFTPENPRMPTLCGCGLNKTYFHLPCLYQWIDRNSRRNNHSKNGGRDCPTCGQILTWQEF